MMGNKSFSLFNALYIHFPFCKQKCSYCDFVSYAGKEGLIDTYLKKLTEEISAYLKSFPYNTITTIYFGGGTPTLLSIPNFQCLISDINSLMPKAHILETTIEANPGTVNKEYLKALRKLGINRISLGAQSFSNIRLKILGRIHGSNQIYKAFEDAKSAGFDNINIDLIFAIPNQKLDEWKYDLKEAIELNPTHISTYNLQIEEGTPLFGKYVPVSEDLDAEMYEYAIDFLMANGYKHYEISNFSKPGFECKHNLNYWQNGNYLGIGAGAHSHINGKRWNNPSAIEEYLKTNFEDVKEHLKIHVEASSNPIQSESIFMGLRLIDGIPIEKFKDHENTVNNLKREGLLKEENGNIKLSKRGLMLGNRVFEKFI